jgi:diketogulonate reductase-like aldo/keto reductase
MFGKITLLSLAGLLHAAPMEIGYPAVGFGTYPLIGDALTTAIVHASKNGCHIIDTATFYENFDPIAKALKKVGRDQFYVISKVWRDQHMPADLRADLASTLEQLQTDYLDAYLLHWPNSSIPIEDTLRAMEELRQEGKIRHIGLSNVTVNHLNRALEIGVPITCIQVEMSPQFFDPHLLAFCQEHAIAVQAWSPLGRGGSSQDERLAKIGKKHGKTASQVALRWILQHGCIPLPSSSNKQHIADNMNVFDFVLTEAEMEQIDSQAKMGQRLRITPDFLGFSDEFDFSYEECWPK